METQRTAGKWYVEKDKTTVVMGGQCVITAPAPDGAPYAEQAANARLIAAAPELLELVKVAFDRFTDNDMMPPNHALSMWLEKTKSVFARIDGRE